MSIAQKKHGGQWIVFSGRVHDGRAPCAGGVVIVKGAGEPLEEERESASLPGPNVRLDA